MAKRRNTHPLKKSAGIIGTFVSTVVSAAKEFGISDDDLNKVIGEPNNPTVRAWMRQLAEQNTKSDLDLSEILPKSMQLIYPIAPAILQSPTDLVPVPFHRDADGNYVKSYTMLERAPGLKCNLGWSDLLLCYKEQDKIPTELRGRVLVFAETRAQDSRRRYVFCLLWNGNRWVVIFHHLTSDCSRDNVLVRSGK